MKKKLGYALLTLGVILAALTQIHAYEIPTNPDRYPSIGLGYDSGTLKGDGVLDVLFATNVGGVFAGGTDTVDEELQISALSPSVRLPLSDNLSLDLRATFYEQKFKHVTDGFDWQGDMDGVIYGGSIRWYIK